jgi:hypothetical protein
MISLDLDLLLWYQFITKYVYIVMISLQFTLISK